MCAHRAVVNAAYIFGARSNLCLAKLVRDVSAQCFLPIRAVLPATVVPLSLWFRRLFGAKSGLDGRLVITR
jgi:hypothetical protein